MSTRCASLRALLVWTVLTASTIGPGTVTMCSKAGADYGATLVWAVLISAAIARMPGPTQLVGRRVYFTDLGTGGGHVVGVVWVPSSSIAAKCNDVALGEMLDRAVCDGFGERELDQLVGDMCSETYGSEYDY